MTISSSNPPELDLTPIGTGLIDTIPVPSGAIDGFCVPIHDNIYYTNNFSIWPEPVGDYTLTLHNNTQIVGLQTRPNWFWRMMQYLCFGWKWTKEKS
jgi:hypothetical protein